MKNCSTRCLCIIAMFYLCAGPVFADDVKSPPPAAPELRLCDALEGVQTGDRLRVTITAVAYNGVLYDPFDRSCSRDVQPITIIEWPLGFAVPPELKEVSRGGSGAVATFTGVLWGELRPGPDRPDTPVPLDYANRVGGFRRFGPNMIIRSKLVVERIAGIRPAEAVINGPPFRPLTARSPFPVVRAATLPNTYPWKAKHVGVSGDVVIEVTLGVGSVVSTKVIHGDRLLVEDALATLKTWKFDPDAEATFTTTFKYRFEELPPTTATVRVQADLPVRVEIIAPSSLW